MYKKTIALTLALTTLALLFGGCGMAKTNPDYKIAVVSDGGYLNDGGVNQAVWEGLMLVEEKLGIEANYAKPAVETTEAYMKCVDTLVEAGYNIIVFPTAAFNETLLLAQEKYPDIYFIGVDCELDIRDIGPRTHLTTILQGAIPDCAAISAKTLEGAAFGGISGSDPAQTAVLYDFMDGLQSANRTLNTNAAVKDENFIVCAENSFQEGQKMAAQLFDRGVDCIVVSFDLAGRGALAEARVRREAGADVWVVGSSIDLFEWGSYIKDEKVESVVLISSVNDYQNLMLTTIEEMLISVEGRRFWQTKFVYSIGDELNGISEENKYIPQEILDELAPAPSE